MGSFLSSPKTTENRALQLATIGPKCDPASSYRDLVDGLLYLQKKDQLVCIVKALGLEERLGFHKLKHGTFLYSEPKKNLFGKPVGTSYFYVTT